jgi:serine/threonine protein kinase
MGSESSKSEMSLRTQQQIDACCQAFENAWKAGDTPRLEEFVTRVSPPDRTNLLRELLKIEMNYRRDGRGPLSDSEMCDLHPGLKTEIADQMKLLRDEGKRANFTVETRLLPSTAKDNDPTIDHEAPSKGSRGLHIRCPHCSNPVELLTDTPFESITCRTCGSAFSLVDQDEQTLETPTLKKIGRFELVARLGVGGFGTVWKARDTELERTVAVKIPRKGQLARDEIEQFFREARSAAQLRHPNIVPVHEVGRDEDTIFIVSDLIRGVSMGDWLSGATPNSHEIAQLMAVISDALHHAHQKGVIHRDLKPSNILLDDAGQPHIMDFGLAKREAGEITMTVEGRILGTPAYMSPEQAAGEGHWTDRRTDIYSLGVILFRMLTGELPFRGNAQMQIHQRLNADPPDPRQLNRHLPRDMCTICLKCLERDPNRRFSTAKELSDEFLRFLRREPILSRPISRVERGLRWAKRKPALATAMALTAFLAIAGPVAAVVFQRQQSRLQARVIENDNLIDRYRDDIQKTTGQITTLRNKLDVWEGKADPWAFWVWPPKRDAPPRRDMVSDVLDKSGAILAKPLGNGEYDARTTAAGYLGLGILAEGAGKNAEAIKYYERARHELTALQQNENAGPQVARALADCHTRLAHLKSENDQEAAAEDLKNAEAIYRQVANEKKPHAQHQIEWLEAELRSAFRDSADNRMTHLKRINEINRELADKWPTDPAALYRLACYLMQAEPILLLPAEAEASDTNAVSTANPVEKPASD